jgi:DNA polymerase I-like protein with 3'-5' exonuclease and polymerase domains
MRFYKRALWMQRILSFASDTHSLSTIFRRRFSVSPRRNCSTRSTRSRAADAFVPLCLSKLAEAGG